MSFNIWRDGGLSLSNCVEVIRRSGADIVGLQECKAATAGVIATNLGFHWVQGGSGAQYAVVSRFPITRHHGTTRSPRGGLGVEIALTPSRKVHVFNAHLHYTPYGPYWLKQGSNVTEIVAMERATRMPGLEELLVMAQPHLAGREPVFVLGDFNAPSHLDYADFPWPTSLACEKAGLRDAYRELHPNNRRYPGPFAFDAPGVTWTPITREEPHGVFDRIDFVLYSDGDGVTPSASVELDGRNSVTPWPSDHRAVLTTFWLKDVP